MLAFLNSLIPFLQAGINFHIYPFLTDQGFSQMTAVLVLSTISVFGMIGSAIWGMLTERFRIQSLLTVNVFGNGLVFLLLYWAVKFKFDGDLGTGILFFLAALHGTFHGGRNPMITLAWAGFFGRRSLGSILSLSNPFHYTANAIGPVFAALCFDLFGSYAFPFYFFVVVFFLSGIITIRMQPPRYPS
jgi:MFS-type transporter involved in bile tolerance (Atg22 family)